MFTFLTEGEGRKHPTTLRQVFCHRIHRRMIMCFESGTLFIDNGYRPAIVKRGRKWAFIMFINGSKIRCKREKAKKVGRLSPIGGAVPYTTSTLADQFLTRKTLTGDSRFITKMAVAMLKEARNEL
jgi:hypothetical protein